MKTSFSLPLLLRCSTKPIALLVAIDLGAVFLTRFSLFFFFCFLFLESPSSLSFFEALAAPFFLGVGFRPCPWPASLASPPASFDWACAFCLLGCEWAFVSGTPVFWSLDPTSPPVAISSVFFSLWSREDMRVWRRAFLRGKSLLLFFGIDLFVPFWCELVRLNSALWASFHDPFPDRCTGFTALFMKYVLSVSAYEPPYTFLRAIWSRTSLFIFFFV